MKKVEQSSGISGNSIKSSKFSYKSGGLKNVEVKAEPVSYRVRYQ